MATNIKQIDDPQRGKTIFRVDGEMLLDDALLLEKIVLGIEADSETEILLDLADLDYLDSDAASILRRLDDRERIEIDGMEIFLQTMVNEAERKKI